ncbi:GntR family transcriptional regulator [Dellaglioa algida]|uniref:Transcriptional regulator n=1 Tax=Dellaglioa algida DSM 15638 TaxID=1423719 RepID=A0A0R1HSN7_9LACO|nr:GntR family transcriptional regulator [Dellaglioa algida]KRK45623.1 transcriptional regulator [Dellaglioa algida DSM 15638]MDK1719041.1 GntR family transcriptional regulator [Dellaglioa algida]MDK1730217.1 GntR family transcriptional regulator [Dellaglioa algida]MDK1733107.1 GntR family transcriptional regulator [Dellaglioa algida]MDK1734631.1 GntR family transcriptional regulator [Dellaglioa algida]
MYRYREIYSDIKRDILTNHYRAGSLLPTQEILTEKYEVSRLTLKKSLNLLIDEGLVYSKQGSGTYVRPRMDTQSTEMLPLDLPIGVTYSHRDQKITSRLLYFNARLPTELERKNLQILSNDPVYEIKRIRLINNQVYSFEHSVMPVSVAPINEKILSGSVYDYLGSYAKIQLTDARRVVYAEPASEETSQALEVDMNSPIFVIDQIAYDQKGRAFEYSTSRFVSNHNKFVLDVHLSKMD